jgi:hypothetical protein
VRIGRAARHAFDDRADAKVEHQRVAARARGHDHDVARLEVAVDHALCVGVDQRVQHLQHQVARFPGSERAFPCQHIRERIAGRQREHRVKDTILGTPGVDELYDIRMVELGAQAGLAQEPGHALLLPGCVALSGHAHELDRDRLSGGALRCLVHLAKPTLP